MAPNVLQAEAIRSQKSAVLVLASPGTGKTRVLRARMAYLLISKGVPSNRILTVAFSQHAVSQLRSRVGAFTNSTQGMWMGTFHSICARMVDVRRTDDGSASESRTLRGNTPAQSFALRSVGHTLPYVQ